jgi:hypothetical protein
MMRLVSKWSLGCKGWAGVHNSKHPKCDSISVQFDVIGHIFTLNLMYEHLISTVKAGFYVIFYFWKCPFRPSTICPLKKMCHYVVSTCNEEPVRFIRYAALPSISPNFPFSKGVFSYAAVNVNVTSFGRIDRSAIFCVVMRAGSPFCCDFLFYIRFYYCIRHFQ